MRSRREGTPGTKSQIQARRLGECRTRAPGTKRDVRLLQDVVRAQKGGKEGLGENMGQSV